MKDRYVYPAIIEYDKKDKAYNVTFPDLEDVFTFGEDLEDAIDSAVDVLQLMLYDKELEGVEINEPSSLMDIKTEHNQIAVLIDAWMIPFRSKQENKSVNKNITLPKWLNDLSEKQGLNFSQIMQAALKYELGIKENQLV